MGKKRNTVYNLMVRMTQEDKDVLDEAKGILDGFGFDARGTSYSSIVRDSLRLYLCVLNDAEPILGIKPNE